jgi:hypothetical protein
VARLALHLTGNVGNTIDVTRLGASYPPFGSPQQTDPNKTIPGVYDDPFIGGTFQFLTANQNRYRNAQREPGVFNQGGTPIDGGALALGGIWGTFAHNASTGTPDAVAAAPAPSQTTFGSSNGIITNSGDYVNAVVTFLFPGPDAGAVRVISSTTANNQQITISQQLGVAPVPGNNFTVTAFEMAGIGQSTFVTDSGPSVTSHNTWGTVVTDFGTQVSFAGGPLNTGPFTYTWQTFAPGTFGSPFP